LKKTNNDGDDLVKYCIGRVENCLFDFGYTIDSELDFGKDKQLIFKSSTNPVKITVFYRLDSVDSYSVFLWRENKRTMMLEFYYDTIGRFDLTRRFKWFADLNDLERKAALVNPALVRQELERIIVTHCEIFKTDFRDVLSGKTWIDGPDYRDYV
jgi:hypothetical protein